EDHRHHRHAVHDQRGPLPSRPGPQGCRGR
ncbi:MAG: hypothetical protein AVDCRST_MAG88-3758, partial [uncultured Thermomicrobiales bacterium]